MQESDVWQDSKTAFGKLCGTIAALRHPVTGCPWDLEQTHSTLRKYMIEEAYEAAEVMDPENPSKLRDELGDVLLQVVLNSQLAKDAGTFTIKDVIEGLNAKMRRRHPHVFGEDGNPDATKNREKAQIRAKWEDVKAKENGTAKQPSAGVFSHLKPGSVTPAGLMAVAIGKVAKKISFDWGSSLEVFAQFESEVIELKHEVKTSKSKTKIYEEMGDVFFSLGQLCRHLDIDPEVCAMDGNKKFLRRFELLEDIAKSEGVDIHAAGTARLEDLWLKAKAREQHATPKGTP